MSIFTKTKKRLAIWGRSLRSVAEIATPIVALFGPGKYARAVKIALAVIPVIGKLITRNKNGETMDNVFTRFVDATVKAATTEATGLDKIVSFIPAITAAANLAEEIKDQEKAIWVPKLRDALDARIGSEPEALIGDHENALIKIDIAWVPIETISDIAINLLEAQLLKAE